MPAPKNRSYRSSKTSTSRKLSKRPRRRASRRAQRRSRTVTKTRRSRRSRHAHRRGRSRRRSTRVKSRSRRKHGSRKRRISRRKASSRARENTDIHTSHGLLKPNPFIKCTYHGDHQQELVLKPPSSISKLPKPPKSKGSTLWLCVPFQAGNSLTVDDNGNPFLKTDENGAYEVVLPNFSMKVLLSSYEDIAHKLGIDPSGSLSIAVPTGCVATWDPSYKNDVNYESVYTINNPDGGNPDGAWMLYAPLELPEKPPPANVGPKTIDNLPAVQRVTVDGKQMLKFRFQVPIRFPLPGGGFIDIQAKLNTLEPGQKLRLNMLYPPELPLSQQRTIGVEIDKDQGPGTFIQFQLPASLWDENERARIVNDKDAEENSDNIEEFVTIAAAVTVGAIFVYNIPNLIRLTNALGSLLFTAVDAGFQPLKTYFWQNDIEIPKLPSPSEFQPSIDRGVRAAEQFKNRFGNVPQGFIEGNYKGLTKMTAMEQELWFSDKQIGNTGNNMTHFDAVFMDIRTWDKRQANGAIYDGVEYAGIHPSALETIAARNPIAFSFIGRDAPKPWVWETGKLQAMIKGCGSDPDRVRQLMVSVRAGTNSDKYAELGANYEQALKNLDMEGRFPNYSSIEDTYDAADEAFRKGESVAGDQSFDLYKAQADIAERTEGEDIFSALRRFGSHGNVGEIVSHVSPRRRISPRLARLMKRYKTIQQHL